MRLLHIADVHLERPFRWLGTRGGSRRNDLKETLGRVVDLALARRVDALCIAGDLFERESAPPATGDFLRSCLAGLGDVPVLIAPGNHDFLSPGCLYDQVTWPANVHIFRGAGLYPLPVGDGVVWGCGFDGPERHRSPLADFSVSGDTPQVGLFHADVVEGGATSPYGPLNPAEIRASGLHFAMLGHIHAGRIDQSRGFAYPGSLEPLDVSERGPRGALLIDVTTSDLRVESIPIARRRVLDDVLDVSDLSTFADLRRRLTERRPAWANADVRLRLVGTLRGELEQLDDLRSALGELEIDFEIVAQPDDDLIGLASQNTTVGAFVRKLQDKVASAPDDEQRQKWSDVLRVGIAAFRGREVTLS